MSADDLVTKQRQAYYSALCDVEDGAATEIDWKVLAAHARRLWTAGGEAAVRATFAEWLRDLWEEP